jgi:hypothetical protein
MKKEVVISAYEREYSWIELLDSDTKVTVYRKDYHKISNEEIHIRPNVGRCVHTFFYHLYHNYDNLADLTYFSQDYHLDHVNNYVDIMNGDIDTLNKFAIEKIDNQCWFFNTQFGAKLNCDANGFPHGAGHNIKLNEIWEILFDIAPLKNYEFTPSGHFAITKKHARKIDRRVYKQILDILEKRPQAPREIERLETYIFIKNYENLKIKPWFYLFKKILNPIINLFNNK